MRIKQQQIKTKLRVSFIMATNVRISFEIFLYTSKYKNKRTQFKHNTRIIK